MEIQKDIKFKSGRIQNVWDKCFINRSCYRIRRTLEATSIHMTIVQVNHLLKIILHIIYLNGQQQKQYNEDINNKG